MKLSIVVPALNEEALIGRCLEAVARDVEASGGDVEIVVVDNGSTDRTAAIAAQYPGVRVVSEPARGIVRARSRGFSATTGEIAANLDADTTMPAGWIATVRNGFARDLRLVALSGPVYYDDLPAWQRAVVYLVYQLFVPFYALSNDVLRAAALLQGGNFVVRRSAWEAAGGYDTSIDFYGEDTDVARRLLPVGRVKWTLALPVVASGRRFAREGLLRTTTRYFANYISMSFAGHPATRTHTDIRQSVTVIEIKVAFACSREACCQIDVAAGLEQIKYREIDRRNAACAALVCRPPCAR